MPVIALQVRLTVALAVVLAGALFACGTAANAAAVEASSACAASDLTLHVERDAGRSGRSHGVFVVIGNAGRAACSVPALPSLALLDTSGKVVARGVARYARFMHPGPFLAPLTLDPGASVAAKIGSSGGGVDGPDGVQSVTSALLALTIGGVDRETPLVLTVRGRTDAPVTFVEDRFTAYGAPGAQRSKTSS